MDHSKQIAIARQLLDHIDAGTTSIAGCVRRNDASVYVSPDVLQLELKRIFLGHPLVAGLTGDIPDAGSFVALEAAGVPYILVRGRDGQARAYLNACRHR